MSDPYEDPPMDEDYLEEQADTQARALELENARKKKAAEDQAKKELANMEQIIKREQDARAQAESSAKDLLARKERAEKVIKELTAKRLAKAQEIGGALGLETFLIHFLMGGVNGEYNRLKVLFQPRSDGSIATALFDGAYILAARVEENPAFPVFFLSKGGGLLPDDHELIKILKGVLQKYMKPYVHTEPNTIKSVLNGF